MTQTFGSRISALRKEKGMTQSALAEKMGVTDKAVSKWERDLSFPDVGSLPKLAQIFELSVDELLQGTPGPEGGDGRGKRRRPRAAHLKRCGARDGRRGGGPVVSQRGRARAGRLDARTGARVPGGAPSASESGINENPRSLCFGKRLRGFWI